MGVPFFGPLMKKLFGSRNQRMVKRFERIVDQVNALEPSVRKLTDAELRGKTLEFRARIKKGEKAFGLMPEVFAVAREAMDRAVGHFPFAQRTHDGRRREDRQHVKEEVLSVGLSQQRGEWGNGEHAANSTRADGREEFERRAIARHAELRNNE